MVFIYSSISTNTTKDCSCVVEPFLLSAAEISFLAPFYTFTVGIDSFAVPQWLSSLSVLGIHPLLSAHTVLIARKRSDLICFIGSKLTLEGTSRRHPV